MGKYSNDNEELSFIALAAATANVIRWLTEPSEEKKIETDDDANTNDQREKDPKADRYYVEARLRELRAWEKRIGRVRKP